MSESGNIFPTVFLKSSVVVNGKLLLAIKLANMVSAALSTSVPAVTHRAMPPPVRDRAEAFVLWQSHSVCRLT